MAVRLGCGGEEALDKYFVVDAWLDTRVYTPDYCVTLNLPVSGSLCTLSGPQMAGCRPAAHCVASARWRTTHASSDSGSAKGAGTARLR